MPQNIGEFLTNRARRDSNLEAIYEHASGRRFSYTELNGRSNQVAHALRSIDVAHGDRVGLLLMNGTEFIETFFAVAKIGAVNVPLNWRLVADELEFILDDAGVTVLLFSQEFSEVVAELRSRGDKTQISSWIQVDAEPIDGAVSYEDWMSSASSDEPQLEGGDDDLAFIMYTSGTTGLPKGVMHSHDTVLWANITNATTADMQHYDRFLNALPLFHVGALTPVVTSVFVGGSITLMKAFDPAASWDLIRDEKINTTLMVPVMLQFMLLTYDAENHDTSTLRNVISGAAPVPVSLIETYTEMGIEIHQVYGLTETCGPACIISSEDAVERAGSTGKAFTFTEVQVVDDNGNPCEAGEAGEVLVKGPHIMLGYWNRPEANAEALVDGWLKTGDVATMDSEGFVTIVDRVKDMLISGGENVYPAEIENVLLAHEKINDAGVIGIPSKKWGESPLAVIVRADDSLSEQDVMDHCVGKLAPFKTVKAVEFIDVIPRNASGKILKRELRDIYDYEAND
ncbi:MAG: 2-succinylbenzoyl-CoA synthetase [Acidimicrobiaceae bacterium]|nr:2-succinylbenzoyl-CoA synthetase [Acidimicrobiaceae bacterium]|tara:strand:+ start:3122 stop:4660 length:1539 start_codon:yes stop_codon:yes gene_type:complete